MFTITGLVVPVPMLGERPSECCVGSHFLLCFICVCVFMSICSVLQLLHELLLFIA